MQVVRHCSLAIDYTYFIYSSAKSEVLENNFNDLILHYHKTFIENLEKLNTPKDQINLLTINWLKDELRKCGLFGLVMSMMVIHAIFADQGKAVELEIENEHEKTRSGFHKNVTPEITQRLRLINENYLKNIVEGDLF